MTAAYDFGPLAEMEGTVAARPAVRTQPVGEQGEPMPVLCLTLKDVGPSRHCITCNQVFPIGGHAAAHARAAQLKPGMRVKVQVALELMECHFPVTTHIGVVRTESQTQPQSKEVCHA